MGRYSGKTCRLLTMLSMTASFFLVEIIVGYITNSIALVADSFHMLSDVVALIVGFVSVRISKWRTQKNTYGWARAEVLGALVNSVFLVALCFSIIVEALKRLVDPEEIKNPKLMLIVGGIGLLVNFIGLGLFHQHGHSHGSKEGQGHSHKNQNNHSNHHPASDSNSKSPEDTPMHNCTKESEKLVEDTSTTNREQVTILFDDECDSEQDPDGNVIEFDRKRMSSSAHLNMRAVFLHVLGDALGSVIVVISALMIWLIDAKWVFYADPAMSIIMVVIILVTTIPLLKEAALILLQTVPTHIKVNDIKVKIEKIDGVQGVHEFHVWQLTGDRLVASAHVRFHAAHEFMNILGKIKALFHNEGIHSVTIQPEYSENGFMFSSQDCMLTCGPDKYCNPDTCCPKPKRPPPNGQK